MHRLALCALSMLLIAASEPKIVEVWTGGEDGLTQRLAEQLRRTFAAASASFDERLSTGLVITIPTHVATQNITGQTKISYRVSIVSDQKQVESSGSCWEEEISVCADQVLKAAYMLRPE